ncbi:YggT family protein [Agromyces neolithicus]|uniref:YggT family protein n=1 Tax=Agromyces neolithicus TaxID=269420 RepID=A0ABN2M770_9MICO
MTAAAAAPPPAVKAPWYLTVLRASAWLLYTWVVVGVVSLTLRVFLLLFGANPTADFSALVLRVSDSYLQPFRDIFPPRPVSETSYLDVSAIFAIIVYGLFAGLVSAGIAALSRHVIRAEQRQRDELARQLLTQQAADSMAAVPPAGAPSAPYRLPDDQERPPI